MVYSCHKCKFQFIRMGEIECCPNCGSQSIKVASKQEEEQFAQRHRAAADRFSRPLKTV
jgi:rRNA maturation endonuclease Nob1